MDEAVQEFIDAYYQAYSKAGSGEVWECEENTDGESVSVFALDHRGEFMYDVVVGLTEDVARWVALAHNAAPQLVENIQIALDRCEEMEQQRDAAVARQLELEREAM